tara:strand:+ start:275 stop:754 length:480 start_codon:yes stop_codon:yes gene_type:complete
MVAEILAGIALVKASVDFVKSNIGTIKDIGEIAGQIDGVFSGRRECSKARSKDKGMSIRQQFGSGSPAQAVIDSKLADEAYEKLKFMIIDRWNLRVWEEIEEAQREKVKSDKAEAQAQAIAKAESQETFENMAVVGASIGIAVLILVGVVMVMIAMENQ